MTTHDITDTERAILATLSPAVQDRYPRVHERVWNSERGDAYDLSYGACPRRSDPRAYSPDLACCSPEEVERWAEACRLWDEGDRHPEGPMPENPLCSADYSFGIGVYIFRVPPGWWDPDDDLDFDDGPKPDQGYPALPQDAHVEAWPIRRQP